jgi:hypothetical protein
MLYKQDKITGPNDIIEHFLFLETQSENHSSEYLSEVESCDSIEDLIDLVQMWVRGKTLRADASEYILLTLDSNL